MNGELIHGWVSWEVDNNAYRSADTFRVVFVVSMLPASRDAAWLAAQSNMRIEILAGFPKDPPNFMVSELDSLIYGQTDEVLFDPVQGTIELSGRDLTAALIDTRSSEHFANQTASQIATTLAQRHGLTPVVTATRTKAGDYYKDEHASITQQQSEWELLTFLANVEDYALYVKGQELHFEPRPGEQTDHYVIAWDAPNADRAYPTAHVVSVQFSRALTIAKGITVEVHSWNAKQKKGFTASWPKAAKAVQPGQSAARTQVYRYTIAGLTQDKALQRAQSIYTQIIAHEMRLTADMPADNALDCTKTLRVRGTGTRFDQVYFPESVIRSMSLTEGYRMNIQAKNAHPEWEATP
ncbi:MAG TPA: phage late control D family protein [Xylella sp.]